MQSLGERIHQLAQERGLSLEELGLAKTTVIRWKKGRATPTVDALKIIARRLGMPVSVLIAGTEDDAIDMAYASWEHELVQTVARIAKESGAHTAFWYWQQYLRAGTLSDEANAQIEGILKHVLDGADIDDILALDQNTKEHVVAT